MKNKALFNLLLMAGTMFILVVLFINVLNLKTSVDLRSRAQQTDTFCQDTCTGKNRCDFNSINSNPGDPNYNDPCCQELAKTGDPFACSWPQRGYCTDDQCNAIPSDVNRQRCGGPRHSWCNECISHNCPGYGSSPTPQPTPQSTPTPIATPPPPTPTQPIEVPTPPLQPENVFPSRSPTPVPFSIRITIPKMNINLIEVNQAARKPLDFLTYLFQVMVGYDQRLEKAINNKVGSFFK